MKNDDFVAYLLLWAPVYYGRLVFLSSIERRFPNLSCLSFLSAVSSSPLTSPHIFSPINNTSSYGRHRNFDAAKSFGKGIGEIRE
jgi:hypothetical protein